MRTPLKKPIEQMRVVVAQLGQQRDPDAAEPVGGVLEHDQMEVAPRARVALIGATGAFDTPVLQA